MRILHEKREKRKGWRGFWAIGGQDYRQDEGRLAE